MHSETFHLPLESLGPEEYEPEGRPLPQAYGRERLVLLPRDPQWIFAYWELAPALARRQDPGLGELRLYFEETGELALAVPCDLRAGKFYIKAPHRGRRYFAELGLKPRADLFRPALRSRPVALPRGQPEDRGGPLPSSRELLSSGS